MKYLLFVTTQYSSCSYFESASFCEILPLCQAHCWCWAQGIAISSETITDWTRGWTRIKHCAFSWLIAVAYSFTTFGVSHSKEAKTLRDHVSFVRFETTHPKMEPFLYEPHMLLNHETEHTRIGIDNALTTSSTQVLFSSMPTIVSTFDHKYLCQP